MAEAGRHRGNAIMVARLMSCMGNCGPRLLWQRMNLVSKFALLFVLVGAAVSLASNLTLERVLAPSFERIEQDVNAEQIARARAELNGLNANLHSSTLDYAVWDDMYRYAVTPSKAVEDEIFTPLGYNNLKVEFMAVIRFDGKAVWSQAVDAKASDFDLGETARLTPAVTSGAFFEQARSNEGAGTYIKTPEGLYALQSTWIRKGDGKGAPTAFFVIGRLLSAENLSEAIQAKTVLNTNLPLARLREISQAPGNSVSRFTADEIQNTIALLDASNTPLATMTFATKRRIAKVGGDAIGSALTTTGLGLLFLLALLALGVNRITVMRLKELRAWVKDYRKDNAAVKVALTASGDEIGSLARQFSQLTEELAEAEEQLRQQSYVQGKADSAIGLLHNVRNALGPLQAKYDKWRREDNSPLCGQVITALSELEAGTTDIERRDALERFIKSASAKLASQSQQRAGEIENVEVSINQILDILADYDFAAKAGPVIEAVDLGVLFRREVKAQEVALNAPIDLELPLDMPQVQGNRIHLAQVVGNIVANAIEAMASQADKRLRVQWQMAEGADAIEFALEDNGEGATAETVKRAFERGFSTRRDRSGGIGLHWSANTLRALGGALSLASDGPGQGAVVTMVLPLPKSEQSRSDSLVEAAQLAA